MELDENATGRERLARMLAAAGLTVAAATLLRRGKRVTGVLAGVAGLALGYKTTTDVLQTGPTASPSGNATSGELTCAICGDPIVPGQARGPDENDDIVHVDCREATAETAD